MDSSVFYDRIQHNLLVYYVHHFQSNTINSPSSNQDWDLLSYHTAVSTGRGAQAGDNGILLKQSTRAASYKNNKYTQNDPSAHTTRTCLHTHRDTLSSFLQGAVPVSSINGESGISPAVAN